MFKKILLVQWSAMKLPLLPMVIAAFALPLASVQGRFLLSLGTPTDRAASALMVLQPWLPFYPALAVIVGVSIALGIWAWDLQGKHVYALTLPMTRRHYVLLKMAAGASLVILPGVALWIGAMAATASADVPSGLNVYPTAVAVRFGLASLLAYGATFALSAWSGRKALIVVSLVAGALVLADVGVVALSGTFAPELTGFSPTAWVLESLSRTPGPFGLFTGNWSMIDV